MYESYDPDFLFLFLNFQTDYLRKISMKILTMETKAQNAAGSDSSILADSNNLTLDDISKQRSSCTWQKLVVELIWSLTLDAL